MRLEPAVLAEEVAVVGVEDDQRVVGVTRSIQSVEDRAHIAIHVGDRGMVGGDDLPLVPVGQVAEDRRNPAFVLGADSWDQEGVRVEEAAELDREAEGSVG